LGSLPKKGEHKKKTKTPGINPGQPAGEGREKKKKKNPGINLGQPAGEGRVPPQKTLPERRPPEKAKKKKKKKKKKTVPVVPRNVVGRTDRLRDLIYMICKIVKTCADFFIVIREHHIEHFLNFFQTDCLLQ
jgi:hypothetical protein